MNEAIGYSEGNGGPVDAALAEYFARQDCGEQVDVQSIVDRHPGCEVGLRQFLARERGLHDAVARATGSVTHHEDMAGRLLGDFRLHRIIGRGGMGVVYEAEQISLGRRVALKLLPFASMLDERQLTRFKNEARAAATLHHPNIVAVYSVGSESGTHYYAMQLIEGQSLAQVIDERRRAEGGKGKDNFESTLHHTPSTLDDAQLRTVSAARSSLPTCSMREYWRTVARLGIEAAEALDHAHQNGILHRDIKPANLLIDASGTLWVTDFGLARIEQDAAMTMTGDLIGTLRYMSPEQALAKRAAVDHRSDIYSLGATLYELLTLRPLFGSDDRQELLQKIAFDEPLGPRKIRSTIPAELETIVLKALEKEPSDRYGSAQELADDLRRFLDDKPIQARPTAFWQRSIKWSRRHVAAVWATMMASIFATVVLTISTALVIRWYNESNVQRVNAETALKASEASRREAIEERTRAEAVSEFLVHSLQAQDPYTEGKQDITVADAMSRAVKQLDEGYLAEHPETVAWVLENIAMVLNGNGRTAEAERLAERTLEIRRKLYSSDDERVARALNNLAGLRMTMGKLKEAEPLFEEVLSAYQRIYEGQNHEHLAWAMNNLGGIRSELGRTADAEPLFQQALDMERRRLDGKDDPSLVRGMLNLSGVQSKLGHEADAEANLKEALAMSQRLYPGDHPLVAHCLNSLGALYMSREDAEKAMPLWEQALKMRQSLFHGDHRDVATSLHNLAWVRGELGQDIESESLYQAALEMHERLYPGDHPSVVRCLTNLAQARRKLGRDEEAETLLVKAVDMAGRILPEDHEYRRIADEGLAELHKNRTSGAASARHEGH